MKNYKAAFEKQRDVLNVKVDGQLNAATSAAFEKELNPHLAGVREVVADLKDLDYISSAGIRILLATQQYLEEHGGSMRLTRVNDHIFNVFNMIGFTNLMTIETK